MHHKGSVNTYTDVEGMDNMLYRSRCKSWCFCEWNDNTENIMTETIDLVNLVFLKTLKYQNCWIPVNLEEASYFI